MPSLRQAARRSGSAGLPLPTVYHTLGDKQVQFRRGHLHVIASAPGVGKSVLAINLAIQAGVPTLYLAMDGDETSMSCRVMQAWNGLTREEALAEMDIDSQKARRAFDTIDEYVRWDFPGSPDMVEIRDRVWAFAELWGELPHLIVVDNMMDVAGEESFAAYSEAEQALCALARIANTAVVVLAHVNGMYEDGKTTIPLPGVNFKATKKSSVVITGCRGAFSDTIFLSVVKCRDAAADPSGLGVRVPIRVDYTRMMAN